MNNIESLRLGFVGAMAAVALVAGCAQAAPSDTASGAAPRSASVPVELQSLIGDAACDQDAQCHTLGVGARACGGPEAYVAWSHRRTEPAVLADTAARLNAERRRQVERSGMASTCQFFADPGAYCAAPAVPDGPRACRLQPAGPGSAAR